MTELAEATGAPLSEEAPEESEQPGPERDDEEEPSEALREPLDGAPEALSERDIEQALEKLTREASRHANRISEIMGEDAQALATCPLCEPSIPGFFWPGQVDADKRDAALEALGVSGSGGLVEDPEAETCDRCHGRGETLTGSLVLTQRTRPCTKCGGNGWTTPDQRNAWSSTQEARAVVQELRDGGTIPPAPPSGLPPADAWGRPLGHESYGKNPVYMTEAERARDVPSAA